MVDTFADCGRLRVLHASRRMRAGCPVRPLVEVAIRFRPSLSRVSRAPRARRIALSGTAVLAIVLAAPFAVPYSVAPPLGSTGAPGEPATVQCLHCHADYPLNAGTGLGGVFSVSVPADSFQLGGAYPLTITLQQPGQARWGFELVALAPDGQNAGYLTATDMTVTVQRDYSSTAAPAYAYQNESGTFAGEASATWQVLWSAPTDPAMTQVYFYAAAVAADGVGLSEPQGDYVYQGTWTIHQASVPALPASWGRIKALYLPSAPGTGAPGDPRPLRPACTRRFPASHPPAS